MRLTYRARQLLSALTARVSEVDLDEAEACLPLGARPLFRSMPRDGQAHALRVLRALTRAGYRHPSLLAAALLHDVGKSGAWVTPLHRSLYVMAKRLAPGRLAQLPAADLHNPFVALRDHPRIGAEWARDAGCDDVTVWLIAHHQDKATGSAEYEKDHLLRALQAVDDRT